MCSVPRKGDFVSVYQTIEAITRDLVTWLEMMITLGGSPTGVAAPPILEKMTCAIRTCLGSMFLISHNLIVTGVMRRTVVTLSRKAERTPVKIQSIVMRGQIWPRANLNAWIKFN